MSVVEKWRNKDIDYTLRPVKNEHSGLLCMPWQINWRSDQLVAYLKAMETLKITKVIEESKKC